MYRGCCRALLPQRAELHHRAARRLLLSRGQRLGARRAVGGLLGRGGELRVLMRGLLLAQALAWRPAPVGLGFGLGFGLGLGLRSG